MRDSKSSNDWKIARKKFQSLELFAAALGLAAVTGAYGQTLPTNALYARYAAGSALQTNISGVVTQWLDAAGSRALDRIGGQPSALPVAVGGSTGAVLRLDGSDWIWIASGTFGSITNDRALVVMARTASTNDGHLFDGSSNSGMTRAQRRNGVWQMGAQPAPIANAANADVPTVASTSGVWQVHGFDFDHQGSTIVMSHYIDGTKRATVTQNVATALSGLILGANVQQLKPLAVDLAEVIVYSNVLADAGHAAVFTYLTNGWTQLGDIPMRVVSARCEQVAASVPPFGVHGLLRLDIVAAAGDPAAVVTNVRCSLAGTTRTGSVAGVAVYAASTSAFLWARQVGPFVSPDGSVLDLPVSASLAPGTNHLWVAVRMGSGARTGDTLDAELVGFALHDTNGLRAAADPAPAGWLFVSNGLTRSVIRRKFDDGVNTYRIPGLAVSTSGTLLAVFDARWDGSGDLPANVDVALMRSTTLGDTWEPMQIIMDFDKTVPGSSGNGVGDPAILVDRVTGRIWVAALWSFGNHGYVGSGKGLSTNETGQYVLTWSDDDGLTWSAPTSITPQVKVDTNWGVCFQGPGAGIQLRNGTLLFPSQQTDPGGANARAFFIFSTNQGATWGVSPRVNATIPPQLNENQMVELDDGRIMVSSRAPSGGGGKRVWSTYTWTTNLATGTWSALVYTNIDPVCQGSFCRYTSTNDGHAFSRLLFANPAGSTRTNMTVRLSEDEGATWTASRTIDPRPSAYSCLATLPDGTVGLLYETGDASSIDTLVFARFDPGWMLGGTFDADGDGIADDYEVRCGLNTSTNDAAGDLDGDGVSNGDEFKSGTRANDPGSVFRTTQAAVDEAGSTSLAWMSVPWRRYRVEAATALLPAIWTNWTSVTASAAVTAFTLPLDTNALSRYFRVSTFD